MKLSTVAAMMELVITNDDGSELALEHEDKVLEELQRRIPEIHECGYLTGKGPYVVLRFPDCKPLFNDVHVVKAKIQLALEELCKSSPSSKEQVNSTA
jgi:hypothetical protein